MINGAVTMNPKLTFENFIDVAIKDYSLFKNRLGEDCIKYLDKLYKDSSEFEIKDCSKSIEKETIKMLNSDRVVSEAINC